MQLECSGTSALMVALRHQRDSDDAAAIEAATEALAKGTEAFAASCGLKWEELADQVERLEEEDVPVDDFTIEEMKKTRVKLKDKMYKMLVEHCNPS